METVWKRFWVQLRGVSTRSIPRALLGEKCGFVGCEKIENPEMETVETVWKRLGNGLETVSQQTVSRRKGEKCGFCLKWKRLGNGGNGFGNGLETVLETVWKRFPPRIKKASQ